MESDKRRFVRKRTDQLLYAEFGPDNGSILLNLCKDGCSFQSMAPVRQQQVHFSVSVGDGRKLEGEGKMVWSDTTKKTGGLMFLNPSAELQEQVHVWLSETLVTADGKLDPAAVESQAKRRRKELREKARAERQLTWKEGALMPASPNPAAASDAQAPTSPVPGSAMNMPPPTIFSGAWPEESEKRFGHRSSKGSRWGLGVLVVVAVLFLALISYRRELGHWVMSVGSSLAGEEQKSGAASVPAATIPAAAANHTEARQEVPSEIESTKEPEAKAVPVSEQVSANTEQAAPVRRNPTPSANAEDDVPTLWSSVENGDTHAEVTLASRYVRGEGVPQSCAQARVLLEAAVKRGSAEARERLDGLSQAGCP
jgi:TPR repeat protein